MLNKWLIICFTSLLLTQLYFCKKSTEPLGNSQTLKLEVVDVSCTEVWLSLDIKQTFLGKTLKLFRDDSIIVTRELIAADTLLLDDGLEPAQNYNYRMRLYNGNELAGQSAIVDATTKDTTSHDFTWQTYEFGAKGSSVLYDVVIISPEDIWCVGEIYTEDVYTYDSLGNWIDPYNAVHWDGEKWELKRISYRYQGTEFFRPIPSVFAFGENDVWFGNFTHWNGSDFESIKLNIDFPSQINKMWGTSSNDLYIVGNNGLIAHYDGNYWRRIESGTVLGLTDIWGISSDQIYSVGYNPSFYTGIVLKYNGSQWIKMIESPDEFDPSQLFKTQLYGTTGGVWMDEKGTLYTVGNLMFQYKMGKWNYVTSLPENFIGGDPDNTYRGYLHAVRGTASNDIFIFGQSNTIIHFNGITWKRIGPPFIPWYPSWWLKCDVKNELIVGVGTESEDIRKKAKIIMIYRQ